MSRYIHQRPDWPRFRWDREALSGRLAAARHRQGRLIGRMQGLGFPLQQEASLAVLTEDVLRSSEIEGELLDKEQVRSSIARRLGIESGALLPADRDVEGVVEMMLDATQKFSAPLTFERLFGWHAALFPSGRSGMARIVVGAWRNETSGPIQVVSGAHGHERVHFEAPHAARLDADMRSFFDWFNGMDESDPVIRAAIAHLWFVTIHPFDDGNGRIARAIADMCLARSEASPRRFYSMSAQIGLERKIYYDMLEATQKGDLDISRWIEWFLACLDRAFDGAETILAAVLRKANFWALFASTPLNNRQRDMTKRLLDGVVGKLNTSKWAKLQKCSSDTALRDITELVARGILVNDEGGGRNTSYSLTR